MLPVRVLVVDDSVVVRKILCEALASSPEVAVAGSASNGAIALAKIPQLNPDVITLDIEMPGLDGIQTLAEIRKLYPRLPVIMFSTLTERGAAVTLEALAAGASDYMTKPSNSASLAVAMHELQTEMIAKVVALAARNRGGGPAAWKPPAPLRRRTGSQPIDIVAIGTSTGGPNALAEVIPRLPGDFPVPVVLVQHMPPLFTRLLAERLDSKSHLRVHEAEAGRPLIPGQVWIAPGNYHLTVVRQGVRVALHLDQDPPENSCRPAVDVLFRSVSRAYGPNVLGVVMTGMGSDGARGAAQIRDAGGEILVQDEATSVVWGMPGAVVEGGGADRICPLGEISGAIVARVGSKSSSALAQTAAANRDATR